MNAESRPEQLWDANPPTPSLVGVSKFMGSLASTATSASELLPAATDSLQLSLLPNYLMVLWN